MECVLRISFLLRVSLTSLRRERSMGHCAVWLPQSREGLCHSGRFLWVDRVRLPCGIFGDADPRISPGRFKKATEVRSAENRSRGFARRDWLGDPHGCGKADGIQPERLDRCCEEGRAGDWGTGEGRLHGSLRKFGESHVGVRYSEAIPPHCRRKTNQDRKSVNSTHRCDDASAIAGFNSRAEAFL